MTTWMAHVHKQWPIDGLLHNETITGVPVSLDATDPNGNAVHIADVTTDGYSGTFGYTWTPDIAGDYKITATFAGDDSYGSSFAATYANVKDAPTVTSTNAPVQAIPDYTMTILATGIGIAIVVVIVGIAIILVLRKR